MSKMNLCTSRLMLNKRISRQDWKTWYVVMDPFFLVPRLQQYLHRTTPVPLQKNVKHTTKESRAKMEQCKYFDFQPSKEQLRGNENDPFMSHLLLHSKKITSMDLICSALHTWSIHYIYITCLECQKRRSTHLSQKISALDLLFFN